MPSSPRYYLAYIDGEMLDVYIKPKYREVIADFFDSNRIFEVIGSLDGLEQDQKHETYTLKCNWHNVEILAGWLQRKFQ